MVTLLAPTLVVTRITPSPRFLPELDPVIAQAPAALKRMPDQVLPEDQVMPEPLATSAMVPPEFKL